MDRQLSAEERELIALYGLDQAQLRWRRWCINANCGGDGEVFAEEYPANDDEAFLKSGRPALPMRALLAAYQQTEQAPPQRGEIVERAGRAVFSAGGAAYVLLYAEPEAGHAYIIGVDAAAGYQGGDYSAMAVLDKRDLSVAACWHGHIEPDLLGEQAALLGRYYRRALIVPEANNHGVAVIGALRRAHYGHVYRRPAGEGRAGEWGFLTTAQSKIKLTHLLAGYLREDAARVRDRDTLAECMSYVYDEKGHANAQAGCHDDRVIALALAVLAAAEAARGPLIEEADWAAVYGACPTTGY